MVQCKSHDDIQKGLRQSTSSWTTYQEIHSAVDVTVQLKFTELTKFQEGCSDRIVNCAA